MASGPRIDFIIIGIQKAGTTALYDYLSEDSALGLSQVKEAHFFDDETVDWSDPDYASYHAKFDWERPAIRGEATPIYIYWPSALERIARYNPSIRLVLMLRDPVERAWSHWKMEYARGIEARPFSWGVRQGRRRMFEAEPWGVHREFSYVERGFYGEQVERLFEVFRREQVLILQADSLRRDPNSVLAQVNQFLGAAPPSYRAHREVHVGAEIDYGGDLSAEDIAFLRQLYETDQVRLEALTGIRFP